jgi:hydroxymethylpyrimidine pyrophosphatase-like HAD family hydrolase
MENYTHHYLNPNNVVERLVIEWKKYGKLVIAYDFDNTVYDYHKQGHIYDEVIQLLRECHKQGAFLTVFTACADEKFPWIKEFLTENNIPFDAINESPDYIPFSGRKIYYNILLDDRAGLQSAYEDLKMALTIVRGY